MIVGYGDSILMNFVGWFVVVFVMFLGIGFLMVIIVLIMSIFVVCLWYGFLDVEIGLME